MRVSTEILVIGGGATGLGVARDAALRGVKTLEELAAGLTDASGWAYVGDKDSPLFGALYINCTHKNSRGVKWSGY